MSGKVQCGCGKSFARASDLKRHERNTHLNIKVRCGMCAKVCGSQTNLKAHMNRTHAPHRVMSKCGGCDLEFKDDNMRNAHCRKTGHGKPMDRRRREAKHQARTAAQAGPTVAAAIAQQQGNAQYGQAGPLRDGNTEQAFTHHGQAECLPHDNHGQGFAQYAQAGPLPDNNLEQGFTVPAQPGYFSFADHQQFVALPAQAGASPPASGPRADEAGVSFEPQDMDDEQPGQFFEEAWSSFRALSPPIHEGFNSEECNDTSLFYTHLSF